MTLIFGKLTGSFADFASVIGKLQVTPNDPELIARLAAGQIELKRVAALDSLYLTLIGVGMFFVTYAFVSLPSVCEEEERFREQPGREGGNNATKADLACASFSLS